MSNKIPTIVAKQLEEKAKALPVLQQSHPNGRPMFKNTRVLGADLIKEFPDGADEWGNPFNPTKYYWRDMPILVNHEVALRHKFTTGGMEAVDAYCQEVRDFWDVAIRPRTRFGALLTYWWVKVSSYFLRWKHPMQERAEFLASLNKVKPETSKQ
jgi:hypothetical protein